MKVKVFHPTGDLVLSELHAGLYIETPNKGRIALKIEGDRILINLLGFNDSPTWYRQEMKDQKWIELDLDEKRIYD